MNTAQTLGLRKSFGFGDRLGLATPGHLAAVAGSGFSPILAQQSVRELDRTQRTHAEVMAAAQAAVTAGGFTGAWGGDADHHKTPEDVRKAAAAGFTFFTIDPSAHVNNAADRLDEAALRGALAAMERDGVFPEENWLEWFLSGPMEISDKRSFQFTRETLMRAVVKYGRALAHCEMIANAIEEACAGRQYEIEVSVDETDTVTSPLEHLYCGLELQRRDVAVVSLAPRFCGEFEKGIDYRGDLKAFDEQLREHAEVAEFCGPYKISIHSGSDKFSIYPIIGAVCGNRLHVKTSGTSYLEALRVVARARPALFAEITAFCRGRFEADRKSYHISTTLAEIERLPRFAGRAEEAAYLDERVGRQLLHVTFGSVLSAGVDAQGRSFKEGILETVRGNDALHSECLVTHLGRHVRGLEGR
jgi:hypothetical protein